MLDDEPVAVTDPPRDGCCGPAGPHDRPFHLDRVVLPGPVDGIELVSQSSSPYRVVLGDPSDPTRQIQLEGGTVLSILGAGSVSDAVVQRRAEHVHLCSGDVRPLVDHEATEQLASSPRKYGGLARVQAEALAAGNLLDDVEDLQGSWVPTAIARQRDVIGVTGVLTSPRGRQCGEPDVEPVCGQVGKRRGGRGTVRQVRRGQSPTQAPVCVE